MTTRRRFFDVKSMVIDDLVHDVIPGQQLMVVNLLKLLIDGEQVNFSRFNQEYCSVYECEIPAFSERFIYVRWNQYLPAPVSIRGPDAVRERAGVVTASGLIKPNNRNRYPILVCNLTSKSTTLPARTIIAVVDEEYEVL